jgi:hypothetical protein
MTVRAKFKVDSIERSKYGSDAEIQNVKLSAVYGGDKGSEENKKFWKYTPTGNISLGTINADAAAYFELGEEYYIDFTKAEGGK